MLTTTPGSVEDEGCQTGSGFKCVVRYCKRHRPPALLLENVASLFTKRKTEGGLTPYDVVRQHLEPLGYLVWGSELNAADFGVPQQRRQRDAVKELFFIQVETKFCAPVCLAAFVTLMGLGLMDSEAAEEDFLDKYMALQDTEALGTEEDLRQSERQRPSAETCSAQKGTRRWEALLKSMLSLSGAFQLRLANMALPGGFETKNLHYLSIWWLNSQSYGAARLSREVTDAWVAGKWELGGVRFNSEVPGLTDEELSAIPGSMNSLARMDEIPWEVLERSGSKMVIKRDENKYWSSQTGQIGETYKVLKEKHQDIIGRCSASNETVESIGKLDELHKVDVKVPSELANVELILCKDETIWICAGADKVLGKHQVVGGVGTGQWVPETEASDCYIPFTLPEGDKTLVQLDESSFSSDAQGVSTSTLFKLLLKAEKEKGIVSHKFSFVTIERSQNLDAGADGFDVKIKSPMVFNCMVNPDKTTSKNVFNRCLPSLKTSEDLMIVYRFRFERVGQSFKVQRPYIVTARSISLKKGMPLLVSKKKS
ncbi:Uncharacterized protein SCF082_LOCUS8742 [Durusdinium trenchii]|uniref:DNA (cytosine-5-)-methyltransferase n=1 Tax=Durusdinium trenchii TaxID=1381693 RepID=A0ABP0IUL9_9DINO